MAISDLIKCRAIAVTPVRNAVTFLPKAVTRGVTVKVTA
jgi:hypothetical protein